MNYFLKFQCFHQICQATGAFVRLLGGFCLHHDPDKRFGAGGPEFECGNVQKMSGHINHTLGPELEQGIKPPFIAEKFAVEVYAGICGEPSSPRVYREGEHCYSYTSFLDGRQRVAMTSARAEDGVYC